MSNETNAPFLEEADDKSFSGFSRVAQMDPKMRDKLLSVQQLLTNSKRLPAPMHHAALHQAMSSAEFPQLTAAVLERRLAAEFAEYPTSVESKFLRAQRMNFNLNNVVSFHGTDYMPELVGVGGEYTNAQFSESNLQYKLKKWGRKIPLAWELLVNDDLGAFNRLPNILARGARMNRDRYLTKVFWGTTGALTANIDATNGSQTAVASLPLNAANLATAIAQMAAYTFKGDPLLARPKILEVPPALEQTAVELLEARNLAVIATGLKSTSAGTIERFSDSNTYIRNLGLEVSVNPWIPKVVTSGTVGATCWSLYCDPNDIPAGEMGVLMGEEDPQVFVKTGNQQRVGGGMDGMNLSFETDSVEYKVRDVFEAVASQHHGRWHSNGQ